MFEHKTEPPLNRARFIRRLLRGVLYTLILTACSLAFGMCGYHYLEKLSWLDSLLNASMILGGMGPVDLLKTECGKLFASFYALYSGLALVVVTGILLTPVFHRVLHTFHYTKT